MTTTAVHTAAFSRRQLARADDPLFASKLVPPRLPDWVVSRPRIEKRIAEGARGPLTLVTGPPGAGKTMAVAAWATASSGLGPIAWVTLDGYDNRPRVFWAYIVEALRQAGVAVPRTVWASIREHPLGRRLVLQVASAIAVHGPPVFLALDDLHLVTERRLLGALGDLLRIAKPAMHVVAASRTDPLLPLHRYRLAGELTEIRADELAFRLPEAELLLAQHGLALPAASLEFLTTRAEGWAAVLRLAAISMMNHPDPEQFLKEVASEDSAIAGYLVEEVLNAQPAGLRSLLLKTSILDRVSAGLAGELSGQEDTGNSLRELAQAHGCAQPLGGGWYRYHALFAEVLRLKLRHELPGQVADLHRRAAEWLRRNGTLAEAVRHATEAGDWQLAARIAIDELAVSQLIDDRGANPLAEALGGLRHGSGWTEPQPWLVRSALSISDGGDEAASQSLAAAEQLFAQLPAGTELPARLSAAVIRLAMAARSGDLKTAVAAAAQATALLSEIPEDLLARHPEAHAQILADRGKVELWSGQFDEAGVTLEAGAAASDDPCVRASCLGYLALLQAMCGRLNLAAEHAVRAEQLSGDHSGAAMVALALVYLERHELPEARRQLTEANRALRTCPGKLTGALACLVAARICLAEGRPAAAGEMVSRVRCGWSPVPWLERRLALVESYICGAAGNTDLALEAAGRAGAGTSLDATVALARALLAGGDVHAARRALAEGAGTARDAPDYARLEGWLVQARLSHGCGDSARTRRALEHALALAQKEQLRLPFAMERDWLEPALERHPDLAHAFRPRLPATGLAIRHAAGPHGNPAREGMPTRSARHLVPEPEPPLVVEKLSKRECEVLRGVSRMLGTDEIATEMYISVNTVKSHLKSVFRKLGATNRNEAVRRAQKLQLI